MRPLVHLAALGIGAALALSGCGVFGGDDGDFYNGTVTVALTGDVAANGQFARQNVYNPYVREIIALVQVENAKEGARVEGRWYQMGAFGQDLDDNTPQGALLTTLGFTLTRESIRESGGAGRLTFRPHEPLPEDSYELRIYVDGKLAKTQPFVIYDGDFYRGNVAVALTDNVATSGSFVRQNIYNPNVREIIALVQVEKAKEGTKVEGRWYQMGVFGQKLDDNTPQGALVTTAGFTLTRESISENGGVGRLTFRPNEQLPEDSYELRIYIDGKLAKTQPFVVSVIVPGPAGTSTTPSPGATPVRTATPVR